jgi:protein-L-isoaspartate(D-aspartate) O-methyltransferase
MGPLSRVAAEATFDDQTAWRSSSDTNTGLIRQLAVNGMVSSERVMQAMQGVDRSAPLFSAPACQTRYRANYVLRKQDAYEDSPQSIGYNATIS